MSKTILAPAPKKKLRFRQSTLNAAYRSIFQGTPREAAERAHRAGGPSLDELEARIVKFRADHAPTRGEEASA